MTRIDVSDETDLGRLAIATLAVRARGGSVAAYEELVRRFEPRLFNFLRHRLRSLEDVEDVTQEAFLRAWTNIHRYDDRWQFSTWLFTIGTRLAIGTRRRRRPAGGGLWTECEASPDLSPPEVAERTERHASIWGAAETVLNDDERTSLWLRYAEDMPMAEIARVLGRSPIATRVMMHRARRKLGAALDDAVGLAPDTRLESEPIALAGVPGGMPDG